MSGPLPSCNQPSVTTVTAHYHKPIIFRPNLKINPTITINHALKQSNLSTQKNPVLVSFIKSSRKVSFIKSPQKVSFLGPIYNSDVEVVQYSLSLLSILFRKSFFHDCRQFHGQFMKMGVINLDKFIQNKLAMLYWEREEYLDDARKMFDEIPERDICVYAALMSSYCRSERWVELFEVFSSMVHDGMLPDKYLVPTILKACAAMKLSGTGKMVHGFAMRNEMLRDIFVGNSLIDFYLNCGDLRCSINVFDTMQEKDVVSWTALVSAYMKDGYVDVAMDIFESMEINGLTPDLISWNALVSGFARNGEIDLALQYWEEMQYRGLKLQISSWNGVISGCVQSGLFENAFDFFYKMMRSHGNPNAVTVVSILMACAGMKNVKLGKTIHGYALKYSVLRNIHVKGALIYMYSICGMIDYAEKVFVRAEKKNTALWNEMVAAYINEGKIDAAFGLVKLMVDGDSNPDEITYNTILSGYARHGRKNEAYEVLSEMTKIGLKPNTISCNTLISGFQQYGLSREALSLFRNIQFPNAITIAGSLAACADLSSLNRGKEIHGYVIKNGFNANIFVSSALVDMYAKCSDMMSATKIFSKIEDKNTVSWNSLIAGHIKDDQPKEGFKLFNAMLFEGITPSLITFMILFPVCGDMKALSVGRALHGYILKRSWEIELDFSLVSALADMYAKCGCLENADLVGD